MTPETVDGVELELTPTDRIRSPADVLHLMAALVVFAVGLALALWARGTIGGAEADLAAGLRLTSRWERVILGLAEVTVAVAAVAVVVYLLLTPARRRILLWLGCTVALAVALTFALDWMLARSRVPVPELAGMAAWRIGDPAFPSSGLLAGLCAGVVFGSPWMTRRWRQVGWLAIGVLVVLRVGISEDPSVDVLAALGLGAMVGSLLLLVRGAPSLEPSGSELVASLRAAGLCPSRVVQVAPGHTTVTYLIDQPDASRLRLGVRTQHDRSAEVLTRLWQTVRLRPDRVDQPFNTLRQRVEHEALAMTLAERAGVRVPAMVTLVGVPDGGIGIAEQQVVPTTAAQDAAQLDAATLAEMWRQVGRLHGAAIAHRRLDLERFHVERSGAGDDGVWLTGLEHARLVAGAREQAQDVAQLLTDTALAVGAPAATDAAIAALGPQATAAALPLLQPLALPRATRRELRGRREMLEELREEVQTRTGVEGAPLERIERVRPRTLVTILALSLAFYLVLPQLADLRSTADAFVHADWLWAPWILVGSALTYVFAAVSFVGSVPEHVPFAPALRSRVAAAFVGLIAPANSGSIALGVRFLQRSGVESAPAVAAVGLNTAAGFVVHMALMVVFVVWNGSSDMGSFSLPSASLVLGALAVVLAVIGILMLFKGIRDRVLGPTLDAVKAALGHVGAVLANPARVAALLGGCIATTLAYLLTMEVSVAAFGGGPTFTQVAVGYLVAAAFGSVAPTPGGLGAFEAAMITALTGFGMASGAAVSATLAFRLATYWLPVAPGWAAFTWMQRNQEI